MASTRGKRLSPEVGLAALARSERHVDALPGQLSQTLSRAPHVWLTARVGSRLLQMRPLRLPVFAGSLGGPVETNRNQLADRSFPGP
jgi:hypothetical protein